MTRAESEVTREKRDSSRESRDSCAHDTRGTGDLRKTTRTIIKFKGLGHVILGNFSTDQMVIELTKI